LIVIADASTGSPARNDAIRATFIPCSASGIAHPKITSSTSFASTPGALSNAAQIAVAAKSSGRVALNVPRGAFPTAVLTALTITASAIFPHLLPFNSYSTPALFLALHAPLPQLDEQNLTSLTLLFR
jgi:hypothetical protein